MDSSTTEHQFTEESREKSRATKKRRSEAINVTTIPRRRREPGEVASRALAIRWFCYDCMGFDAGGVGSITENVRQCTAPACPLFPWRNGKLEIGV